jgi:isoamylase
LLLRFRKQHPALRHGRHPGQPDETGATLEVAWHGTRAWDADWSAGSRVLALTLLRKIEGGPADVIYVGLNMHWEALGFELPSHPQGRRWHVFMNTAMPTPEDVWEPGQEPPLQGQDTILVGGRSVVVLVAKPAGQG